MAKIHSALAQIMAECPAIGKDSKNTQQGYKFRGVDAVMNVFSPLLSKYGVLPVPEVLEQTREVKQNSKGTSLIYSILKVRYHFTADDGSEVCATVIGEGMDSGDKASNKAMSVAFKYAMFQIFCIPTEEMVDPDCESHEIVSIAPALICPDCGQPIRGITMGKRSFSPEEIAARTTETYGKAVCWDCASIRKDAAESKKRDNAIAALEAAYPDVVRSE